MEFNFTNWLVLAAVISAFVLGWLLSFWRVNKAKNSVKGLSSEYIQGFNYLVNDRSDKAVEVFVKALEVDSETVELHLALGGLFRKEGQVGRATRIHQNIIARPYLTDDQNRLAVFELAQDYFKAGMLDRAENLFLELVERKSHIDNSLLSLLTIYELEKEWAKAIDIAKKLNSKELPDAANRISHYWCEIVMEQLGDKDFDSARKSLRQARNAKVNCERVMFLEGKLCFEMQNPKQGLRLWKKLLADDRYNSEWVIQAIYRDIAVLGGREAAEKFLHEQLVIHCELPFIDLYLQLSDNSSQAWRHALECIEIHASKELVYWLLNQLNSPKFEASIIDEKKALAIINKGLSESAQSFNNQKCSVCGFESKILNWQCPSCGRWDSQVKNS